MGWRHLAEAQCGALGMKRREPLSAWILLVEDDRGIGLQVRLTVGQVSQTSVAMRPVVGPSRR